MFTLVMYVGFKVNQGLKESNPGKEETADFSSAISKLATSQDDKNSTESPVYELNITSYQKLQKRLLQKNHRSTYGCSTMIWPMGGLE
jgi:uncharacterized protein involved in outer membrane biogenesis